MGKAWGTQQRQEAAPTSFCWFENNPETVDIDMGHFRITLCLFQTESSCKTILMKISWICMEMNLWAKLIFIRMVSHLDSPIEFDLHGNEPLGGKTFSYEWFRH